MALTNSEAEGWRMRSRKSCQASGAVEDPKASAPPSIVAGSGRGRGLGVGGSDQRADLVLNCRSEDGSGAGRGQGSPRIPLAIFGFLYCSGSPRRCLTAQVLAACPGKQRWPAFCNLHVCIDWPVKGRTRWDNLQGVYSSLRS
jgi:hypothetical protein